MRVFAVLFVTAWLAAGGFARAADIPKTAPSPVLVELFTSEGCSSCPPADALLQKMDNAQPFAGIQLIVLSEHVVYWNHDGWKDPYSSASLTERQSAYCHALGVSDPYTPQMIVDGTGILQLTNPQQVDQVFQKAAAVRKVGVRITSMKVEGKTLEAHIETDSDSGQSAGDVYLAVALDHAESQVLRGENGGKHLTHVAVVQSLKKVGKLETGKVFGEDIEVKLKPDTDPANIRLIAFVQESASGKVLGAVLRKPGK